MVICPSCEKTINLNVDKCKNCGMDIKDIFICPYCERTYKENEFCTQCKVITIPVAEYKKIELNYKKGTLFLKNHEANQAIEYYDKALEEFPDSEILNYHKGICYYQLEDFDTGVKYFDKILENNPNSLGANINKAQYLFYNKKEPAKAFEIIDNIIEHDTNGEITFFKIKMLYLLNRHDEVDEIIGEAIEKFPDNEDIQKIKLFNFFATSRIDNNFQKIYTDSYIKEIEDNPLIEWDENNNEKLHSFKSNEEVDEFVDNEFKKTINTDSEEVLIAKAHQFSFKNTRDKGLTYLNKALEINPNNTDVLSDKIKIFLHNDDFEEAEKCLNQIYEINSDDINFIYNKALIFYKKHDFDNALKFALESLEKNQEHELTLSLLVDIHYDIKEYEKALEYVEKFLEIGKDEVLIDEMECAKEDLLYKLSDENDFDLEEDFDDDFFTFDDNFNVGDDLFEEFDFDPNVPLKEINSEYILWLSDEILKIDPNDEEIILNKGLALMNLERYDEALKCLDDGLELNPNYSPFMVGKAQVTMHKGNPKKALKLINKSIKINNKEKTAHLFKGDILTRLGRYKKAIESYDNVLKLDSSIFSAKAGKINAYIGIEDFDMCSKLVDEYLKEYPDNEFLISAKKDLKKIKLMQLKG